MKINGREVAVDFAVNKAHWNNVKDEMEKKVEEIRKSDGPNDEEVSDVEMNEDKKEDSVAPSESDNDSDNDEETSDGDAEGEEKEDDEDADEEDAKLLSLEDPEESKENKAKRNRQERYCVFVRNIPYDVTEEALKAHFEKARACQVCFACNRQGDRSTKGYCFCCV